MIIILFCEMFRNILNETINFFYQTPEAAEKKTRGNFSGKCRNNDYGDI